MSSPWTWCSSAHQTLLSTCCSSAHTLHFPSLSHHTSRSHLCNCRSLSSSEIFPPLSHCELTVQACRGNSQGSVVPFLTGRMQNSSRLTLLASLGHTIHLMTSQLHLSQVEIIANTKSTSSLRTNDENHTGVILTFNDRILKTKHSAANSNLRPQMSKMRPNIALPKRKNCLSA